MTDEEKVLKDRMETCHRKLRTLQDQMRVVFREMDKIEARVEEKKFQPYKKVWIK